MIEYLEGGDLAIFEGRKYRRDKKTGYYLNSTIRKRLHRAVWESYYGVIPKGCHIHHKDEDKGNNEIENLELLSGSSHATMHGLERAALCYEDMCRNLRENAIPQASKWHKSPEGKAWHSEHAKQSCANAKERNYTCLYCGRRFTTFSFAIAKFCSNKCKSAYRRKEGVDNVEKHCIVCGNPFTANRYCGTRTCSRRCADIARARTLRQARGDTAGL